ncbi:MAG: hypothetical protein JSR48_03890 [Verrucomicrobia bacterium]|nr:hypothetical protein [Verrucomicrobiota bacterium]
MKFLRLFLILLGLAAVLAVLVLAAVFNPSVQTWYVQGRLRDHPAWHASVGSVTAGLDHVELENLRFELGGAVVTLPAVRATLPVRTLLWEKRLNIRSLVAKGWTIELGASLDEARPARAPVANSQADGDAAGSPAAERAAGGRHGILSGWELPCAASLDDADVEGDVYVPRPGELPQRIHVAIKGGALRSGLSATLALDASTVDPWKGVRVAAAHGKLRVVMDTPRTIGSVAVEADLVGQGPAVPDGWTVAGALTVRRLLQEELHQISLSRGGRELATVVAHRSLSTGAWAGNWELRLHDDDAAPFLPDQSGTAARVTGSGGFAAKPDLSRIEIAGQAQAELSRLGAVSTRLGQMGPATVAASFQIDAGGSVLRFKDLKLNVTGRDLAAFLQTLQPFEYTAESGAVKPDRPGKDLLALALRGDPWPWLPRANSRLGWTGGEMRGDFRLRPQAAGWVLTTTAPLAASGVALAWGGRTLAGGLDVAVAPVVTFDSRGWQVTVAPLRLSAAGRNVFELTGQVSRRAGDEQATVLSGKWNADLEAIGAAPAQFPGLAGVGARTARGEFSASLGTVSQVAGKIAVTGHDAAHAFSADVQADIDEYGRVDYSVPLKLTTGTGVTDLKAEGSWATAGTEGRMNLRLSGDTLVLDHVRRLVPVLAHWSNFRPAGAAEARDPAPFWRPWEGTITLQVNQLTDGKRTFADIGGSVELTADAIRLDHGHFALTPLNPVDCEGAVTFEAGAAEPYVLEGRGGLAEFDLPVLLGPPPKDQDPLIEGRYTLAAEVTGRGRNLADLLAHRREQYRLASKAGIVRLLAAHVAEALPEEMPGKVSDTLDSAGYMLGKLFQVDSRIGSGQRKLSQPMEAVLNFSYAIAEIGYDEFTVTAVRDPDGGFDLTAINLTSPELGLTGTGRMGAGDQPLRARPLELDLRIGARGKLAELMAKTEMPAEPKDAAGLVVLVAPAHFGGSLDHFDFQEWQHALAKAAVQKEKAGKKQD